MRIDDPLFRGLACLIRLTDGEANDWAMPRAGRVQVTGAGMTWLELVPDDRNRVITAVYFPAGMRDPRRTNAPAPADPAYRPSVWYVDVIDGIRYDADGVAVFIDQYLDVIFTPEGDVKVDDRDELEAARASGELSEVQCGRALRECDAILRELCADIPATDAWCAKVRRIVEDRIARGEPIHACREMAAWRQAWDIRPLWEGSESACAEVIRNSFQTVADDLGLTPANAPRFTAFAVTEERLRREAEAPGRIAIGCFDAEDRLVGTCSLRPTGSGGCELSHLAVLPAFRHRHIGTMLLRDAFARSVRMGADRVSVGIVLENTVLHRWYRNFGFTDTGSEKFDFFPFTCGTMERLLP